MPTSKTPLVIADIDTDNNADTEDDGLSESIQSANKLLATPAILPARAPKTPPIYYQLAIKALKPLYRLQVWKRSHQRDNYQQEVAQRFGKHYPPRPSIQAQSNQTPNGLILSASSEHLQKVIWCHAVSLGETNTAAPLLEALLAKGYQIWLTNTTQTGFARGASRFADAISEGQMSHSYVPVDSPAVIESFLAHVQPIAALFIETELWANILNQLSEHNIPSILVNGRLSASSFKSYQKIESVSASMMQNLSLIIAQDTQSAKRFRQLGAYSSQIRVAGSLKWVINTPQPSDKESTNNQPNPCNSLAFELDSRPIWVAASTHSGEESVALAWQQQLLADSALDEPLLIIVPRHPERFDEIADLIQATGLSMARRSLNDTISAQTQVYLADTMGELMQWYAQADVALVGGSLVDIGGHNPVEPASVATPILMGSYTQSCQEVVDQLAAVGALYQPNNAHYRALKKSTLQNSLTNDTLMTNGAVADLSDEKATKLNKGISHKESSKKSGLAAETLIYQKLQFWLSHPQIAKQAGLAAAELTASKQSVLTNQLNMIEQVIEQSTQHLFNNQLPSDPSISPDVL